MMNIATWQERMQKPYGSCGDHAKEEAMLEEIRELREFKADFDKYHNHLFGLINSGDDDIFDAGLSSSEMIGGES